MKRLGSPAEVVTKRTPASTTMSMTESSRTRFWAMFTPNGRLVRSRMAATSRTKASISPEEVSMIPRPPAAETADASCDRAIQPIGAWTTGISTPSSRVTRLSKVAPEVVIGAS